MISKTLPKKIPGAPKLLVASVKDWWGWRLTIFKVVSVVALPALVLTLLAGDSSPILSGYLAVSSMFMSLALIWTLLRLPEKKPTLSQAYYGGTQVAVKFFIVSFLLFCQFIPVILGLGVYLIATVDSTLPPSTIELVLLGLVAIIIMAPSFYWLTRSLLGIIVVVDKVQRPLASLRQSRSLVKGYFKPVAGRLIVLVLVMFVGLLPQTLTGYIAHPVAALAASSLWQLVTVAILLPVTYLYLIRIYRALSA